MINQQTPQYSDYEIDIIYAVYAIVRDCTGDGELFFDRKGVFFEVVFEYANGGMVFPFSPIHAINVQCSKFEQEFTAFMRGRMRGFARR